MPRARSGPTAEHLAVAARLRQMRERAQMSLQAAADALGTHRDTVRRIEGADTGLDMGQVRTLLDSYQASDSERESVLGAVAEALAPGWWHPYREVLFPWQHDTLGVESAARVIRVWHPTLVPELLRTPHYAQALDSDSDGGRERRLHLLAARQQRLEQQGTHLWAVISEAALWTQVGDASVMREQMQVLRDYVNTPRVRIQVVPLDAEPHPLHAAPPIRLIRTPLRELADHVVVADPLGVQVITDRRADHYRWLLDATGVRAAKYQDAPGTLLSVRGGRTTIEGDD